MTFPAKPSPSWTLHIFANVGYAVPTVAVESQGPIPIAKALTMAKLTDLKNAT
jgi:hypothetical protein